MLIFPIRKAQPAAAVPRGRIGYDISAERLLLHTIQPKEVLEALLSTGVHVPDNSLVDPFHEDAYDWMRRQMAARLTTQGGGAVWFLAQTPRQDLVDSCRRAKGKVLLTCRVPRDRVLLSHYHDWHSALNRFPHVPDLPGEGDDDYFARRDLVFDDFEDRLRTAGAWGAEIGAWPEELRTEVERGWENILEPSNYGRSELWQATTHVLHARDVVEAVWIEH
ncbi:DUF3841 domain-containing protein [Arthrobacter bambusae]|uniref:DUF3841 domain-containing protein n=1 Tax=Arthrobacter bambusae TaxID=1338426 RepID=UPI0027811371|nr:DUF3841 domain-containing protein [Arthrobacter bambusae]MDQ0211916.1 hypothetical protein [Arthrobacter bambusae]MDQ0236482.1 hypothetical protein [Arthrobacter bambusae]